MFNHFWKKTAKGPCKLLVYSVLRSLQFCQSIVLKKTTNLFQTNTPFAICKYECICVYTDVFNHTFLSRENKSHISEMDNVKGNAVDTQLGVYMSNSFEL